MKRTVGRLLCILFAILLATSHQANAQDTANDRLPPASALGDGWSEAGDVPIADELAPAFRDVAGRVYAGPDGGRTVILVYLVADGMTAIRESWIIANDVFDNYRVDFDTDFDFSREQDIADARPVPEGCADARRTYGTDEIGYNAFRVGLTLCASDPDVIVLVYASGLYDSMMTSDVSDAIVETVLTNGDSTPEP